MSIMSVLGQLTLALELNRSEYKNCKSEKLCILLSGERLGLEYAIKTIQESLQKT
jgi:hypothetical protein